MYPDISVVCGDVEFADDRPASLRNPTLLVEVLSPTTEDHDRGAKLAHYRRMASVREVLLLQANEPRAEVYRRQTDGTWLIVDVDSGELTLESVGVRVALSSCYAKTDGLPLDPPPESAG